MKKQESIKLRKKAKAYFEAGMKKKVIAERLGVSRPTLNQWLKLKDTTEDKRGWERGKKRKYSDDQEEAVVLARKKAE